MDLSSFLQALYVFSFILAGLVSLGFGLYVITRLRSNRLNLVYFGLCLGVFYWAVTGFFFRIAATADQAKFWTVAGSLWLLPLAIGAQFVVNFAQRRTDIPGVKKLVTVRAVVGKLVLYILLYVPPFYFSYLIGFTDRIITDIHRGAYAWYHVVAVQSPIFKVVAAWGMAVCLTSLGILTSCYLREREKARKSQILLIILSILMPVTAGTAIYGIFPFLGVIVPDFTVQLFSIGIVFMGIAITKYLLFAVSPFDFAQEIFSRVSDFIFMTDRNGTVYLVNTPLVKILGLPESCFLGNDIGKFLHDSSANPITLADGTVTGFLNGNECRIPVLLTISLVNRPGDHFTGYMIIAKDISRLVEVENQQQKLIERLTKQLEEIKTLRGLLPICMHCKKIRDDKGYWETVESYMEKHSELTFSHGICPDCLKKYYPDFLPDVENSSEQEAVHSKKPAGK